MSTMTMNYYNPRAELRLTRRGRVAILVLALIAIVAVGLALSATSTADGTTTGFPTRSIVVAPGDTLWDIADDAAGSESTRDMVTTIEHLNGLASNSLQSGQALLVPLQ